MVSNLKRQKKKPFSVLDIETRKDGSVISIALYDGKQVYDFLNWNEFLEFLKNNNKKKRFQQIFAHNGGAFDWVSFIESQLDNLDKLKIIASGSQVIFIEIGSFEKPVTLCDSILTLLAGLDKLCDKFQPDTPKIKNLDISRIEEIFKNDPKTYYKYLHNDCISLYQIMQKFMDLIDIKHFPVTAASLAMQLFRERYQPEDVKLWKSDLLKGYNLEIDGKTVRKYVPEHEKQWETVDEFITRSYAGGRVECFRPGVYESVKTYDINSLYPYVMSFADIPDCTPIHVSKIIPGKVGFYEVKFKQTNHDLPPVLWVKENNGLEFVYEGTGVFCSIEIENAQRVGCEIEFIKGLIYPTTKKVFKNYVDDLYKLRKENSGTPLDFICKILLNSLYGKFAETQKSSHLEKIPENEFWDRLKNGEQLTEYDHDKQLYNVEEQRDIPHRLIHIASIITAMARTTLYKYIERHVESVIYCDTDSVHLNDEIMEPKWQGQKLGQMKLEEEGAGVYLGRKQYAVSKSIKFKGLTLKNKLSPESFVEIITQQDLVDILTGKYTPDNPKTFTFHTFPKMRSVLRGEKACKIKRITKRMKTPDYQTNFLKK
jgi:hypothetical protein